MAAPSRKALWIGAGIALLVVAALSQHFDLGRLLTLDNLKASRDALAGAYQARPLLTVLSFFGVYVLAAALSIPGALILTLAAGAMFGLGVGLLVVSFASSLGVLLAFLASRYLLRDTIQARFAKSLAPITGTQLAAIRSPGDILSGIDGLDRAITDGTAPGFVKVLTVPDKDRILGVTIVGEHAGDLLAEFVLAMRHGLGLNKILGTIHTDPTLAEANKYAAGEWKRAHAPQTLLAWVGRYHAWERA